MHALLPLCGNILVFFCKYMRSRDLCSIHFSMLFPLLSFIHAHVFLLLNIYLKKPDVTKGFDIICLAKSLYPANSKYESKWKLAKTKQQNEDEEFFDFEIILPNFLMVCSNHLLFPENYRPSFWNIYYIIFVIQYTFTYTSLTYTHAGCYITFWKKKKRYYVFARPSPSRFWLIYVFRLHILET